MTLIELYDPHELAFPLVGQLEENFELEVLKEIPKDLEKHKNNLLIIVGKTFAELEQYKSLKNHYLAIVVFIKDMEATQIRSLQNTEETFDAFFGIPWQKTALKFYLQDLAEYKAMELKDELELTDQVKGNQTKSAVLQNLFDQAPDDGSLVTSSIDTNQVEKTNSGSNDDDQESQHQSDHSDSGIHLDLGGDLGSDPSITRTSTATATAVQEPGEISLFDDNEEEGISLDLSKQDEGVELNDDIAEEDSGEDLFDLDDGLELDFGSSSDSESEASLTAEESQDEPSSASSLDEGFSLADDELDFAVHTDLDTDEDEDEEVKIKEDHQPSLSLSEDAVEKLKEIDKILDNDSLSESSINELAEEDSLDLSLSEDDNKPYVEEEIGEISLSTDLEDDLDFAIDESNLSDDEIEVSPSAKINDEDLPLDDSAIADEDLFDSTSGTDEDEYTLAEESDLLDNSEETHAGTMMIGATKISELKTPEDVDSVQNESSSLKFSHEAHEEDKQPNVYSSPPRANYQSEIASFDGDLERAAAIISELRNERDYLEKRVNELEKEKILKENSTLDMRAELSEKTIELQLIKKRHLADVNQFHVKLSEAEEAKQLAIRKNKYLEDEIKKLQTQVNFDIKKIKSRERELEDRIDLIKQDAEAQIRNRDSSIIDLKRKIDMLEFNLENAVEKDKKHIESKFELESKVDKVMQTLRNAIGVLEDDIKNVNAEDAGENSNG